jgi:phosphoenolpyruvate carboxylase
MRRFRLASIYWLSALAGTSLAFAEALHPEVEWSIAYHVSETDCVAPRMRQSNEVAGQLDRYKRRLNHYNKCVQKYQAQLIGDHQRIFAAAEHGLTEQQGLQFVETLKSIEASLQSLGDDVDVENDYSDLMRYYSIGHRSSI